MPHNKFKPIDLAFLRDHFRVVTEPVDGQHVVNDLLDEAYLSDVIAEIKPSFATDRDFVVGSQLMKRLGYLLIVPALYSFSTERVAMPLDWSRVALVSKMNGELWLPELYVADDVGYDCAEDLAASREPFFDQLFRQLASLVQAVSNVSNVPRPILWENVMVYVYWMYETVVNWHHDEATVNQFHDDFNVLIHQLSPDVFGERFNPIKRFYNGYHYIEPEQTFRRVRTTCCFNYEASSEGKYCKGCPKLEVNKEACRATRETMRQQSNSYST
ncbi:ferric iron reductase protein FhuF [Alkalibacillus flavidus]|uniref:Ferric iron reductase protein FhuF n=1 Tax=Alkalibacillus flavidus TaxID=546021 RepID=A0ABV2KV09_9BACI